MSQQMTAVDFVVAQIVVGAGEAVEEEDVFGTAVVAGGVEGVMEFSDDTVV